LASGFVAIARKEFIDTLRSKRFLIIIILFVALWAFSSASVSMIASLVPGVAPTRFFARVGMSLSSSMGFVAPILGIALGYAAISREREGGSLKLVLARPIHREDVINGKAIAAIGAAGIAMFSSTLIAVGGGIWLQGVTPTMDDVARLLTFTLISMILFAAYYAICLFFSTLFTKTSRSLLVAIFVWVLFTFIIPIAASLIAIITIGLPPMRPGQTGMTEELQEYSRRLAEISGSIQSFSINSHYSTVANAVLVEEQITMVTSDTTTFSSRTITIAEALTTHWTSLAVLVSFTAIFFVASYLAFTRREER